VGGLELLRPIGHTGDPWGTLDPTNVPMSPQAPESVAAVGAAVSAIATTLAALPCAVCSADDTRHEVPTHDLMRLIRDGANENESWVEFIETLVSTTLLRGNATALIEPDVRGRLTALKTLPWANMLVRVTDAGDLLFDYHSSTPPLAGVRRTYTRPDLLWLKDRSDSGLLGVSRLHRAAAAMSYAVSIQSSAQVFSANIARPGGVVTSPIKINDPEAQRIRTDWNTICGQGGKGGTALLSGGLEWKPLDTLTADDVKLIEVRRYSTEDVCRIFGVPAWLLNAGESFTFASSREAVRSFCMLTLAPWIARIEAAFQATGLQPQYRLKFDRGSLTCADVESYTQALLRGRQGGWLSPNDCREELGWPSVPGGDDISPPNTSAQAVAGGDQPPGDDAGKVAHLDQHRAA
jgi:HK97 family phage portal protein